MKKIAVLTSGGDAPGMNSAIRAINKRCHYLNIELIGVMGGFKGLYEGRFKPLTIENTEGISALGGTILKSSRFVEFKEDRNVLKAIDQAKKAGIEGIIVIGGDGSYRGAMALARLQMPAIALPGTIDNDIAGTQFTIGFNTALHTIVESIDTLRATARSHDRCLIVEVMGRHCGDLALFSGLAGDVDAIITSKEDIDIDKLTCKILEARKRQSECIIVMSENVSDVFELAKILEQTSGVETRATSLGYMQRGGKPVASDRILAIRCGIHAVNALINHQSSLCTCVQDEKILMVDIEQALEMKVNMKDIYEDEQLLR